MSQPDFDKVVEVLSRRSARAILRSISERPKTVREVHEDLKTEGVSLRYRESVYKALERLVSAGLAKKTRDNKIVRYRSKFSGVTADLLNEKLELRE